MWYGPFWIFLIVSVALACIAAAIRGFTFVDIQLLIMIVAMVMSCDMIFCKQLHMYGYVSEDFRGWYSFWANLVIIPALGLVFIKFAPKSMMGIASYIVAWSVGFTWFEIFIAEPYGIIDYPKWKVFPYSTIGYVITLGWAYVYYKLLQKRTKAS